MTASQLIRQAALKTGGVKVRDKAIKYADPELSDIPDQTCWLCGGETGGRGMPTKKAIKSTFTDHPYARGHGSNSVCPGCAFCLSAHPLRNYSILATTDRLQHPSRAEWRDILTGPPEPPFAMCLAVSGQKHLFFKAPVNLDKRCFTVLLEEREIFVIPDRLGQVVGVVEALYAYFTKEEIRTGRYGQRRIRECGIGRWEQMEAGISEWRGRPLFDLALFVAQKTEPQEVVKSEPPPAANATGKGGDKGFTGQLSLDRL